MVRIIFNVLLYLYKELKHYAEGIARGHAPKLNEICIARFPDGKWCRAACKNVISNAAGTIATLFYFRPRFYLAVFLER